MESCRNLSLASGGTPELSKRFMLATIADAYENGIYSCNWKWILYLKEALDYHNNKLTYFSEHVYFTIL